MKDTQLPLVTIVTPTYNKAAYLKEAAESLFAQTFKNWVWWVVLNGADMATNRTVRMLEKTDLRVTVFREFMTRDKRRMEYFPAVCLEKYYRRAQTQYLFWLSDDDLLFDTALERLVHALASKPERDVVYGNAVLKEHRYGAYVETGRMPATIMMGPGNSPDCQIDGGQILQTKRSFTGLWNTGYRIPKDWDNAHHSDGLYMHALSQIYPFYPVNADVVIHRRTPVSENTRS
jgi:glycosyltransferase involved in cell wall biosynthesis